MLWIISEKIYLHALLLWQDLRSIHQNHSANFKYTNEKLVSHKCAPWQISCLCYDFCAKHQKALLTSLSIHSSRPEQEKNPVQNRRRPLGAWRWNFDVRCNCLGDTTRIHINVPAGKMRSPFTSTFTRARSFWSNQAGQALERMPKRREQGSREATP